MSSEEAKNAVNIIKTQKQAKTEDKPQSLHLNKITSTNTTQILDLYLRGKFEECLEAIDKHETANSRINNKILQAGCWSNLDRNYELADSQLREVIEKDPGNFYAYYGLGLNFYLGGEFENCIQHFIRAFEMSPYKNMMRAVDYKNRAERVLNLMKEASTEFSKGNYYNAVNMLDLAPAIDPNNGSIKRTVSQLTKTFLNTLVVTLEAEALSDTNVNLKVNQAGFLVKSNMLQDAAKLIADVETARGWFVKGLVSYYSGSLKLSVALFKRSLAMDSIVAEALEQIQKATKLIELIEGASKKMKAKENAEAIKMLTIALEVDVTNKRIVQAIYFQRAMCRYNLGEIHESFKDYQKFEVLQNETGLIMDGIKF